LNIKLSIVIVSYRTPELLLNCISSIKRETQELKYEIIVVDNAQDDGSKELVYSSFTDIVWINSGYNAGFSRANNIGIRRAQGEYILLLNPDTEIKGSFLSDMILFYKQHDLDNKLGLLSCRIISLRDGSLLVGSGIGFYSWKNELKKNPVYIYLNRVLGIKTKKNYQPEKMHYTNHEIDFVSGACMLIKKSKIGSERMLMDEDFFLYWEDAEWSFRIKYAGFVNYFWGDAEVYHVNSASTEKTHTFNEQLFLSSWLFLLKTQSKYTYFLSKILFRFNYKINTYLLKKASQHKELQQQEKEAAIFFHYVKNQESGFSSITSSSNNYLNYAE